MKYYYKLPNGVIKPTSMADLKEALTTEELSKLANEGAVKRWGIAIWAEQKNIRINMPLEDGTYTSEQSYQDVESAERFANSMGLTYYSIEEHDNA